MRSFGGTLAKVKVTTKFSFKGLEKWEKEEKEKLGDLLIKAIPEQIRNGKSPVKPGKRYQRYSESYRNQIKKSDLFKALGKKRSPVNLTLSGQLLDSIFKKVTKEGLIIGFKDKLADIHNRQGASKIKVVRRMLPTEKGELFSKVIQDEIQQFLKQARSRLIKILNE